MKLNNFLKFAVVAAGTLVGVSSCDYLDVVPPEQANLEDAMKTHSAALGFLYSCYNGTQDASVTPTEYQNVFSAAQDEWVLPNEQEASYPAIFAANKNTQTTNLSNITWHWGTLYQYIGQCLLFEEQLKTNGRRNEVCQNDQEEAEWLAESRFLRAYYHYQLLRSYGPIPLTTERIPMDSPDSDFPGRSHFDYCVRYICNEFDAAYEDRPMARESINFGRATKPIAKIMKARLLLLAASPLFNGSFPYPEWKNTKFETPGYGKELVSREYSREKWVEAYNALKEAIDLCEDNGFSLMTEYEAEANVPLSSMNWIPVDFEDDVERDDFLAKVMLNRYIHTTSQSENPEIVWAQRRTHGLLENARMPLKVIQNKNGTWYASSWSVVNPTLNTVFNFYCKDGLLPADSHSDIDFPVKSDWYKAIPATHAATGHESMINLVRNREPRFYAWIAFDGGNYLSRLKNGEPLTLDFKLNTAQGHDPAREPKNLASTGFLAMKHVAPVTMISSELVLTKGTDHPVVLARLSELYLSIAEAAAELAKTDDSYVDIALSYLNAIRDRAGVPELDRSMIGRVVNDPATNSPKTMSLVEWVRQERFIELWDEGTRYFDIRRWVAGPEYLGNGVRMGLTGDVENPTFEQFNTPKVINENYTFATRQYLYPVFINEVYKNPQMVQAPGY
ncbi:MAG: RagB/SusD family nutrient uptake outer membrane protein [Muribaculaceae bacterium]|nr:RagB/SusD family nutrient uptake outer membrane protein [Muribaculaceae bacterium]